MGTKKKKSGVGRKGKTKEYLRQRQVCSGEGEEGVTKKRGGGKVLSR